MFGWGRRFPRPVGEREATGDLELIYHEVRQVLRVPGVSVCIRALAGEPRWFASLWTELGPILETTSFEASSDLLRIASVELASGLVDAFGPVEARARAGLGPSQRHQLDAALALHHYLGPKLLLLHATLRLGLSEGATAPGRTAPGDRIVRGPPISMAPLELVPDPPSDPKLARVFDELRRTFGLEHVPSLHAHLAMWPRYLSLATRGLERVTLTTKFEHAREALHDHALELAARLPRPLATGRGHLRKMASGPGRLVELISALDRAAPVLCLETSLLALEVIPASLLAASPFPAARVGEPRSRVHDALAGVSGAPEAPPLGSPIRELGR